LIIELILFVAIVTGRSVDFLLGARTPSSAWNEVSTTCRSGCQWFMPHDAGSADVSSALSAQREQLLPLGVPY